MEKKSPWWVDSLLVVGSVVAAFCMGSQHGQAQAVKEAHLRVENLEMNGDRILCKVPNCPRCPTFWIGTRTD